MFGGIGLNEFLWVILLIVVLSMTGWWPRIVRGLRELRGEEVEEPGAGPAVSRSDLEVCYKMLGLSPSAPWEDIEKAYRNKAKVHHPDRGGDEDAMRALNDAYNTLKHTYGR